MPNEFSSWLSNQLSVRGWSQAEFAKRANIDQSTVAAWLSDQGKNPNADDYATIAKTLDMPLAAVLAAAGVE